MTNVTDRTDRSAYDTGIPTKEAIPLLTLRSTYMQHVYDSPDEMIERARYALADADYDTLVGTGLSGALVIPTLARALGKHWLLVRKPGDGSHSHLPVEGNLGSRWVFVDDFVSTGATLRRVRDAVDSIKSVRDFATTHVGNYLYEDGCLRPVGFYAAEKAAV